MAAYDNLRAVIAANVYQNNNNEVTADMVKAAMEAMVASLGAEFQFGGVADPDDNPGTPDYKVAYLASTPGTYTNFGGKILAEGEVAILLWNGSAWSKKETDIATSSALAELDGEVVKDVKISDAISAIADYLVDKDGRILAYIQSNGEIVPILDNYKSREIRAELRNIVDSLSYVSSIIPGSGPIIKYLVDINGTIIGTIDNKGGILVTAAFTAANEEHYAMGASGEIVKAITDARNSLLAYIDKDGRVHIPHLATDDLQISGGGLDSVPAFLFPLIGMVASGTPNRKFVNDKTFALLKSSPGQYNKQGSPVPAEPCITLYDDDAIDYQLPTSRIPGATPETRPTSQVLGGYASVLFPLIHAFNKKYGAQIKGKITVFTAAEGQRIGLTPLYTATDDFDGSLNNNGQVLKRLIETGEWEAVCHSMTARYDERNYLVDGLDSSFADEVLANGNWAGEYRHDTTTCYDIATGKNYQIKQDKSGWTELPARYAKPYCAVSRATNAQIVINPTYSVKYQVDAWFKRADIAGLPYSMKPDGKRVYANWGSSHSVWHINENFKWADCGFGGTADTNPIPFDTVAHRFSWEPKVSENPGAVFAGYTGDFNLYTEAEYERMKSMIDACVSGRGWSVIGSHANTAPCANMYLPELLAFVPSGASEPINLYDTQRVGDRLNYYDPNYPEEWTIPLNYDELQDIIGDNVHDYLNTPPARLNISSWDEWYPRPGTGLALLWDSLRYAISRGVRFITAADGFEKKGNLFTLGYKGPLFAQDAKLGNIPEENKSHLIIGADGSIDYSSNN